MGMGAGFGWAGKVFFVFYSRVSHRPRRLDGHGCDVIWHNRRTFVRSFVYHSRGFVCEGMSSAWVENRLGRRVCV